MLIVIPARSGSKRLPGKNIKSLLNKPLMQYTIEAAINSKLSSNDNIYLNTDSESYALIAEKLGIKSFKRIKELAMDNSKTEDVLLDMFEKLNYNGDFILLQTTSPLRNEYDIRKAYSLYKKNNCQVLVSCKLNNNNNEITEVFLKQDNLLGSKKVSPNGAIYISNTSYFKKYKTFYSKSTYCYLMSTEKSVDIDTEEDFIYAEKLLKDL